MTFARSIPPVASRFAERGKSGQFVEGVANVPSAIHLERAANRFGHLSPPARCATISDVVTRLCSRSAATPELSLARLRAVVPPPGICLRRLSASGTPRELCLLRLLTRVPPRGICLRRLSASGTPREFCLLRLRAVVPPPGICLLRLRASVPHVRRERAVTLDSCGH